jgi:hypothetical protein
MANNNKIYRGLPKVISSILITSKGWLVGSSIRQILNGETPRDFDIIVSNGDDFQNTVMFLRDMATSYKINTCGGLKFDLNGLEVDIWVEDLEHFMRSASSFDYIYSFRQQLLLKLEK